jgi:hypothetical protein
VVGTALSHYVSGCRTGGLPVVQRRSPLRCGRCAPGRGFEPVANQLECAGLARLSARNRARGGNGCHPPQHPHGAAFGRVRIRGVYREDTAPSSDTAARRSSAQEARGSAADNSCVQVTENGDVLSP